MKRFLGGVLLGISLLIGVAANAAGSREKLFHQGLLFDTDGNPITVPTNITFRLYDVSTGGTALWEETQNVLPDNGVFTTELGSDSSNPFPSDLF